MARSIPAFRIAPGPRRQGDTLRQNSNARGYTYRWRKWREQILNAEPLCRQCLKAGRTTEATEVDHIIPHRGDEDLFWQADNVQPLCKSCHSRKTAQGQ